MSQPPWSQLEQRMPAVAERALRMYGDASPRYQGVVPEPVRRYMTHTCREFGRLYARMARERREPHEDELRLFRERGRDRAAEGVPVADYVETAVLLAEAVWDELSQIAGGEPSPEAAGMLLRCLHRVMHAGVEAHQQELQVAHSEERRAVRATVRALAAGEPASEVAVRFGIRLAESYGVLVLQFTAHPTESVGDAVGRRIAGRRKVLGLTEQLHRAFADHTRARDILTSLDAEGGLVLIPSDPQNAAQDVAAVRTALPQFQQADGVDVIAGFAHAASLARIPAAISQARRLLSLPTMPGEVAVLDERLFEYHVRHDSDAVPHLRAIVEALRSEPDLLTIVTAYFTNDFNRRATAMELHIHPNTVDNRLSRVATLTNVNPRTAQGLLLLGAALEVSGPGPAWARVSRS
jgi:sugar diacid utilization regulator